MEHPVEAHGLARLDAERDDVLDLKSIALPIRFVRGGHELLCVLLLSVGALVIFHELGGLGLVTGGARPHPLATT